MSSSSPIPSGAADRIVRNPHCLPRVPSQLAGVIATNRNRERHRSFAEQAYLQRRSKVESERTRLIMESKNTMNESAIALTPSPPSSPLRNEIDPLDTSMLGYGLHPRAQSFAGIGAVDEERRPLHHHRSTSIHSLHHQANNKLNRRSSLFDIKDEVVPLRSVYYTPGDYDGVTDALQSLAKTWADQQKRSQAAHRRHSVDVVQYHFMSPPLISRSPEAKAKLRCKYSKRPIPSWRSTSMSMERGPYNHPGWHRMMRDDYKSHGMEYLWKDERNRFLQDYRRDRQFLKQTQRRLSSASM